MSSKTTRVSNRGGLEAVKKRTKIPGTVDVGIIDAGPHESGDMTVAEIGLIHEYGTATIPERSFMRSTINEEKKNLIALQRKLQKKMLKGEITMDQALSLLGEFFSDKISQKIVSIKSPPNSARTIEHKRSSNPLVDTAQLKNSIKYEVNR